MQLQGDMTSGVCQDPQRCFLRLHCSICPLQFSHPATAGILYLELPILEMGCLRMASGKLVLRQHTWSGIFWNGAEIETFKS